MLQLYVKKINMKFIFDLDGTITSQETLPLIARHFNVEEEIANLTKETIKGNIPFIESFIRRVHILGKLPVDQVADLLSKVNLYNEVFTFIQNNRENCIIATGNLDCWISKLANTIGCKTYTSEAKILNNQVAKLVTILRKEDIVNKYKSLGEKIVYIGDGNNDAEAMRLSDISIAAGLTHMPSNNVLPFSNYLVFNQSSLCRQLNQLL